MANRPVVCMDGVRKGRVYHWPEGTREFQINTLVPGSAEAAFYGAPLSGYAGFIYKVYVMWGTGVLVAFHDRVTT